MQTIRTSGRASIRTLFVLTAAALVPAPYGAAGTPGDGAPARASAPVRDMAHLPPLIVRRAADGETAALGDRGAVLTAFGREARVDFHAGGLTILQPEPRAADAPGSGQRPPGMPIAFDAAGNLVEAPLAASSRPRWRRVEVTLDGAAPGAMPVGEDRQRTIVGIFKGREPEWRRGLPTFAAVRYPSAWPGVDVVFAADGDGLAARVEARPGADASAARLAVRCVGPCPSAARGVAGAVGTAGLAEDARALPGTAEPQLGLGSPPGPSWGSAVPGGGVVGLTGALPGPAALVELAGDTRALPGTAEPQLGLGSPPGPSWGSAVPGGGVVGLAGASHSRVVLGLVGAGTDAPSAASTDPGAVVYAGFWGFPGDDRGLGVAVGRDGAAYVTGHTFAESETDIDAYIVKVRPDGTALDYVEIVGGDGYDTSFDVAVDAAGNAYFVGTTTSRDDTRPAKGGPDLTLNGSADAFVGKLNPAGDDLVFCGVLGGLYYDMAEGVAVDGAGHAYVTGMALSSASSFPVKVGPDLTSNGKADAFITKLEAEQTAPKVLDNIVYSGFIGGNEHDAYVYERPDGSYVSSGQMAVDAEGAAYISGQTKSTEATFPDGDGFGDIPGADQTSGGTWDAWIAKVRPDGAKLAYATFWGGAGEDLAFGMDVDAAGAAYFTGWVDSKEDTLHPVVGPDLTFNGDSDAMAGKLTPDGRAFAYLGYIGGAAGDAGMGARVDAHGRLAVIGYTESSEATLPTVLGPDVTYNGHEAGKGDALVAVVAADPSAADPRDNFVLAGYVGGTEWDEAFWPAFGPDGSLYVVGDTNSGPDTFPDGGGLAGRTSPHGAAAGGSDAFVVKIAVPAAADAPTPGPGSETPRPAASATPRPSSPATLAAPTARPTEAMPTVTAGGRAYLPWGNK